MDHAPDTDVTVDPAHAASAGASGMLGVILVVFGGLVLTNFDPDRDLFAAIMALSLLGSGLYFTVAGAVAFGIVLTRR